MKRRNFLKGVAAGLGTPALWPGTLLASQAGTAAAGGGPGAGKTAIVAGGGITGLCCAYELMRHGVDVQVLEAAGRYGGHVYTGRDELVGGLDVDYGADHLTRPGYETLFDYVERFGLEVMDYPNAEGAPTPAGSLMRMIGGRFYDERMLADPATLASLGFNRREAAYLAGHGFHELEWLYLADAVARFKDVDSPFGHGLDALDAVPLADLYRQQHASEAALAQLGGDTVNALHYLWQLAVKQARGIPRSEGACYRLKGGNIQLPRAFARQLGDRLKLGHAITAIDHDAHGVRVSCRAYGRAQLHTLRADYLVNCIALPVFRRIAVNPGLSPGKQYVVDNLTYSSHPFYVFVAASRFWQDDGLEHLCMYFDHPDISMAWAEPQVGDSGQVIVKAFGPSGLAPQRVLEAFRSLYPGRPDTIFQCLTHDWSKDRLAPTCEMELFPPGQLRRFWPEVLRPDGRLYFAGTYADAHPRGMESCVRSARRVAAEIAQA